jgi:hypothetical protein
MECFGEDSSCEGVDSTVTSQFVIFMCRRCNVKGCIYYGVAIITDLKPVRTELLDGDPTSAS